MTIDEAIKRIEYAECEHCSGLFCKQGGGCWHWHILEMLRELKWYRSQDLIRREDLLKAIPSEEMVSAIIISEIPKAKPTKENNQ